MKSICKNCHKEFNYTPSQSRGIFCSNICQGIFTVVDAYENQGKRTLSTAKKYFRIKSEYKCSECGISEWNGKPITLQIDHVDGDISNNEMNNLRFLCPNCHTQTETWGTKNSSIEARERMRTNVAR